MKSLREIKQITENALEKKRQKLALDRIKKIQDAKTKERDEERRAREKPAWYVKEIESAARKGKRSYEIDSGIYPLSRCEKLAEKYIKEQLSDFHPIFTDVYRFGGICNWEGTSIGENPYTARHVKFSW